MAVSNLSPYQLAIQAVVGKGKGRVPTTQQLAQAADQTFGPAPITPGSQIIFQDASTVRWRDPEGYEHEATRDLDGRNPSAGQWRDNTNRPNVLPDKGAQSFQSFLQNQLQSAYGQAPSLPQLDPQTLASLQAISQAEQASIAQQGADQQGRLVAQLYGNRVNQSSIANDAASRFAQQLGLVYQQQRADAANRELQARNTLLSFLQGQQGQQANLYSNLTGQQSQRDIASGGLNLDYAKLAEGARQANQNFELGQQQADMQLAEQRSAFNKFLKGLSAASALAGGVGGLYAGLDAYKNRNRNTNPYTANLGGIAGVSGF